MNTIKEYSDPSVQASSMIFTYLEHVINRLRQGQADLDLVHKLLQMITLKMNDNFKLVSAQSSLVFSTEIELALAKRSIRENQILSVSCALIKDTLQKLRVATELPFDRQFQLNILLSYSPAETLSLSERLSYTKILSHILEIPEDFILRLPLYLQRVEALFFAMHFDRVPSAESAFIHRKDRAIIKEMLTILMHSKSGEIVIQRKEKKRRDLEQEKDTRGSQYRGVSKNGLHWQVSQDFIQIFMNVDGGLRRYRGCLNSEIESARMYDKAAVQYQGKAAQTNFDYTRQQVVEMLFSDIVFRQERGDQGLGLHESVKEVTVPMSFGDKISEWKQMTQFAEEASITQNSPVPTYSPYLQQSWGGHTSMPALQAAGSPNYSQGFCAPYWGA